jgi:ABC-2 type transport system ATP-binding protein/lipopolysaccharide transport system ATP-binding protein
LDGDGQPVPFLAPGEPATFRMHYEASTPVAEVVFGLGFMHESGANVAGPNSGYERAFSAEAGPGFVDFQVDRLALQPGVFRISTAAVSRGHTYDYQDREYELRIRADKASSEPGMTKFFGTWNMEQGLTK